MNLDKIIYKELKHLVTENRESKNMSKARKVVAQLNPNADAMAEITKIRQLVPNAKLNQCHFLPGITRMYMSGQIQNNKALDATLEVLNDSYIDKFDQDLNGLSCQELIEQFASVVADVLQKSKDDNAKIDFTPNSEYQIVKIPDFKTASQYSQYTDWCITDSSESYDRYTHDGLSVFYFLLKNGFENVEKVSGEGCPLDEYGLSMVAVCVGEEGAIEKVTCRWNHANGGDDNIMSPVEVSKLIGYDVYKVLKPYTPEELRAMGRVPFTEKVAEAQARLRNGEFPEDVFDWVRYFTDGYAQVELSGKSNFINTEGKIISEQWFDNAYSFKEGYAGVQLGEKWNFINREGKILSDQWFDWVDRFTDGYAKVKLGTKYNFINTESIIISEQWFDWVGHFCGGYARVKLGNNWNWINTESKILSDQWFNEVYDFYKDYARVILGNKWNYINTEGKIISDQWFDNAYPFNEGYAYVQLANKDYYLDTNGQLYDGRTMQPIQLGESKRYITEQFNKFYQRMKKVK